MLLLSPCNTQANTYSYFHNVLPSLSTLHLPPQYLRLVSNPSTDIKIARMAAALSALSLSLSLRLKLTPTYTLEWRPFAYRPNQWPSQLLNQEGRHTDRQTGGVSECHFALLALRFHLLKNRSPPSDQPSSRRKKSRRRRRLSLSLSIAFAPREFARECR